MSITEENIKEYFAKFYVEQLTCDRNNKQLLNSFCADDEYGGSLECYLKEKAWIEDDERYTKIYLVKDSKGIIVAYFSLKCGLLYEPYAYDILEKDEKDYLGLIRDAIVDGDWDLVESYKSPDVSPYDYVKTERLVKYAKMQCEMQQELSNVKEKAFNVQVCYPAIELSHFCRVGKPPKVIYDIPFGVGLFWEHIAPLVIDISDKVGCRYLYLFAADLTDNSNNMGNVNRKLLDYYRINLKFQFDDTLYFIKPEYDRGCWCLCQSISDLNENKLWVWKQFVGDWE